MRRMATLVAVFMVTLLLPALAQPAAAQSDPDCDAIASTGAYGDYSIVYAPQSGGSGRQVVLGTEGDDYLTGGSGTDILCGFGGSDVLEGAKAATSSSAVQARMSSTAGAAMTRCTSTAQTR